MYCTIAFVVKPVYSFSDVTRFDSGQNMSVILTYVFHFSLNRVTLGRMLSPSYYRQSCYLWHHREPFMCVKMTIDRLTLRSSARFSARIFRYVILPISSPCLIFWQKNLWNKIMNYSAIRIICCLTLLYCASFVRLRYSLLTYLGVDPYFLLPATMSLISCLYEASNEFTVNYLS